MCDDSGDYEPIISEEWRTARKPHKCYACREEIRIGDCYHVTVQKNDGELLMFKHCARCDALVGALLDAGAESVQWDLHCGVSYREAFGEDPPPEIARLAFLTPDEAQREILARATA